MGRTVNFTAQPLILTTMRTPVLLSALGLSLAATAQTTLIAESFDGYAESSGMVANDPENWALWPGDSDQAISSAFAQSGTNSLACISTNAADGGPGDLLLLLGDRSSGIYDLGWSMLVPSGKGGYFNIQHAENVGSTGSFGLEATFAGGTVTAVAAGQEVTGTYVPGEWTDILINVDLENSAAVLFVNGEALVVWEFQYNTANEEVTPQLGAIDFYSYGGGTDLGEFYIDDVTFVQTSGGGIGMAENNAAPLRTYPNPAQDVVVVELPRALGQGASVRLLDVTGQEAALPVVLSARTVRFDVGALAAGVYFVRLDDDGKGHVARVMKR